MAKKAKQEVSAVTPLTAENLKQFTDNPAPVQKPKITTAETLNKKYDTMDMKMGRNLTSNMVKEMLFK